jgi:hypothetical protein
MNFKRTATLGITGGALAAWLAAAATSNHVALPPIVDAPHPLDARGAELDAEIARLHERLRPTTMPRQPGRNLFSFKATSPRVAAPIVTAAPPPPAIVEAAPPRAPSFALKLSGIGEDDGPDGPVRTAFISGEGQLFMVKEGDTITNRYHVTRISADVVELEDLTDNTVRRLALK